ncbi:MarR family winged helix-turn-helix transcriptional regulator [Nocardia sp. CS682]|uniref:MarR family winged helix-turn-helix transcriptional regulator n=1 Tax=Nocardia sp. CS682 TaxID=1047172 RepID=UPI0010758BB8|nr:MarR family transcriptional regulator [Nocardia sp. CS682]QBS42347.1 MarR family transcriptional regulator [Nocardia sp. CS682]
MDAVDLFTQHWNRERPDVDVSPMAVIGRIQRLSRLFEQDLKRFFSEFGMEFWEFDVLATLRRSGSEAGLTAGALIKVAMVTSGAITNRIDRLVAKGWIERQPCPEDRRVIRVRLTPEGRKMIDDVLPKHMENEQRLLASLDMDSREQLAGLLRTLAESLGDGAPD